jgi:hypothetical protein
MSMAAADEDVVGSAPGPRTIDVGNGSAANVPLDIGADKVWSILFTVQMPWT